MTKKQKHPLRRWPVLFLWPLEKTTPVNQRQNGASEATADF
ncbi:hypothetical protein TRICHSKD4_5434 [Roseibium sp. TrichSKD4]|nr:hypothetical protein TRICHSKD4_5434 [Roseibium sp. TrichSKD4]